MASNAPTMFLADNLHSCSQHPQNEISFFCYDEECYEPLCSTCKNEHLETHKKNKTIPFLLSFPKMLSEAQEKLTKAISGMKSSVELNSRDVVHATGLEVNDQKADVEKTVETIKSEISAFQANFGNSESIEGELENLLKHLQGRNAPETLKLIYKRALLQDINQLQQNKGASSLLTDSTLSFRKDCPLSLSHVNKSKSEGLGPVPLKRFNTCPVPTEVQWLVQKAELLVFDDECHEQDHEKSEDFEVDICNEVPSIEIEATDDLRTAGLYFVGDHNMKECTSEKSSKETLTIYSSQYESEVDEIEELEEFKAIEKVKMTYSESDVNGVETRTSLEHHYHPTCTSLKSKEIKTLNKLSFLSPTMTYQTIEEDMLEGKAASLKNVEHCDPIFCQDTIGELDDDSFELEDGLIVQRQCSLENY